MCMKLQFTAVSRLIFQDVSLSYVPLRKIYKRLACKRITKRKMRDPWHIVKHDFYFTVRPSFSSYPWQYTSFKGVFETMYAAREEHIWYQQEPQLPHSWLMLIALSLEIHRFSIHPFKRLLFMWKTVHVGATLVCFSEIHQTNTTALWMMLSCFFSLSIPGQCSWNGCLVATSPSISEEPQYFYRTCRNIPFHA